jgi:hypothetical protein
MATSLLGGLLLLAAFGAGLGIAYSILSPRIDELELQKEELLRYIDSLNLQIYDKNNRILSLTQFLREKDNEIETLQNGYSNSINGYDELISELRSYLNSFSDVYCQSGHRTVNHES